MDNKIDIDRMAYLIGEEDAMGELDKFTEPHGFSKKYESEKRKMIKKVNSIDPIPMPNRKCKGMTRKKTIVLIAAITATLALSLTAYGISKGIIFTTTKNEETGITTVEAQSEVPIEGIPLINITPGYLPEGYKQYKGDTSKYFLNGDASAGGGEIIIYQCDYVYEPPKYESIEETTIGGAKALITTYKAGDSTIDLCYEGDGQIIRVRGLNGISLEELKKVAENIKYEVIPGKFMVQYNSATHEFIDRTGDTTEQPIPADGIRAMGEEITSKKSALTYIVKNAEIMDKLPALDKSDFHNYDEYSKMINKDGTLKDYKRVSIKWENNEMKKVTETAKLKFAYVTVIMTNNSDTKLINEFINPQVELRTKTPDGTLEAFTNNRDFSSDLAKIKVPIYFDQLKHEETKKSDIDQTELDKLGFKNYDEYKSFYEHIKFMLCDFEPNETKEAHFIYVVDADHVDDAYIHISADVPLSNYVKLK
ncbi:DUF4367 domain-containing protein [Clostridium sp. UBA871]|uniref:DUF4367 domain-containing protein n=1 Tax=Clostridium sp. UBA871 TaxID=1946380 RepID=UPI0032180CE5